MIHSVNIEDVKEMFTEYCKELNEEFSQETFDEFLVFLEIDFPDWVSENLNAFYRNKRGL